MGYDKVVDWLYDSCFSFLFSLAFHPLRSPSTSTVEAMKDGSLTHGKANEKEMGRKVF